MNLQIKQYDDDIAYYVVNPADYDAKLNSLNDAPLIMQEMRRETNDILVRNACKSNQYVVKITVGDKPPRSKVKGYVTFISCIKGSSLSELKNKLGFKSGVLQKYGAYIYQVDGLSLTIDNIAPRGNSDWSAGVTPRDLDNLTNQIGVNVGYHRDYPASTNPIIQFTILDEVPFIGSPRFISPGEIV